MNICNRYGHCCSYTVLEELETEAAFAATNQETICPEDILQQSFLCTGLAFNNFDRFVDTSTGKDTLHDTVGIIFQNVDFLDRNPELEANDDINETTEEYSTTQSKRRRRTFNAILPQLEEYVKKPKLIEGLYPTNDPIHAITPRNLQLLQQLNFSWLISHFLKIPNTPMWVGYNSLVFKDSSNVQKISYLTSINESPTNKAVVLETMKQALKAAEECEQNYMQVTHDLAIAKIAL